MNTPMSPHRRPALRTAMWALTTVGLAILGLAVGTSPAAAHAGLVSSNPADGKSVTRPPATVVLRFTDTIKPVGLVLQVTGPAGTAVMGWPAVAGDTVTQPLRTGLPAGAYEVSYQVVSADGHPIAGRVRFTATNAQAATTPTAMPGLITPPLASVVPTRSEPPTAATTSAPALAPTSASESAVSPTVVLLVTGAFLLIVGLGSGAIWWLRRSR